MTKDELVRYHWPNNKPAVTTEAEMRNFGFELKCTSPNGPLGYREAEFVNAFGVHVTHAIRNSKITARKS